MDLPGWIQSGKGILQFISETLAFQSRGLTAGAPSYNCIWQPFSFLLNGWNEIAETDSAKGAQALRDLQRGLPFSRYRSGNPLSPHSASPIGCVTVNTASA